MPTDSGYSNQKKKGRAQFETVHSAGSSSFAKKSIFTAVYEKTVATLPTSVTDIIGEDGQVKYWKIEIAAHSAAVGDMCRFYFGSTNEAVFEFDIVGVVDANNFYILPVSTQKPDPLVDVATILGFVTVKTSPSGEISVAISTAPSSFNYDGVAQTVEQDTASPGNNRGLPSLNFTIKDGDQLPTQEDSANPLNNVSLPVSELLDCHTISYLDFSSNSVSNASYVEILPDSSYTKKVQIFMSSGEPLHLAFGAIGAETDKLIIMPGGNGLIPLVIPQNTRLSVRAINAVTVNEGILAINYWG